MLIGVFPATKDADGNWRFVVMTYADTMTQGQMIFGTEDSDDNAEEGMLEPALRTMLSNTFKLSSADVDRAVKLAIRGKPAGAQ